MILQRRRRVESREWMLDSARTSDRWVKTVELKCKSISNAIIRNQASLRIVNYARKFAYKLIISRLNLHANEKILLRRAVLIN